MFCNRAGFPTGLYKNDGNGHLRDIRTKPAWTSWITPPARFSRICVTPGIRIWCCCGTPSRCCS